MGTTTRVKGGWLICHDIRHGRLWLENEAGQSPLRGDGTGHFHGRCEKIDPVAIEIAKLALQGMAQLLAELNGLRAGRPKWDAVAQTVRITFHERPHATVPSCLQSEEKSAE